MLMAGSSMGEQFMGEQFFEQHMASDPENPSDRRSPLDEVGAFDKRDEHPPRARPRSFLSCPHG